MVKSRHSAASRIDRINVTWEQDARDGMRSGWATNAPAADGRGEDASEEERERMAK